MEELLKFEIKDLLKKNFTTEENIADMKKWQNGLSVQLTDNQLAVFLIACGNDQKLTKRTIEAHFKIKSSSPSFFRNRSINNENLWKIAQTLNISVLPHKYQNSVILIKTIKDNDYRNYCMESHFKLYFMVIDSIIYDDPPKDAIVIIDAKECSLMHITKIRPYLLKLHSDYFNNALPLSIKATHFVNATYAFTCCFNVTKPFIKSEFLQRMHFHRSSSSSLIPEILSIPKQYLPCDLGGDLKSIDYYHEKTMEKLAQMQSYFDLEEKQHFFD